LTFLSVYKQALSHSTHTLRKWGVGERKQRGCSADSYSYVGSCFVVATAAW